MSSAESLRPNGTTIALGAAAFVLGTALTFGLWFFGGFALGIFGMCSSAPAGLDDVYYVMMWLTPLGGAGIAWLVMRWHHQRHLLPADAGARRFGRRSPFERR